MKSHRMINWALSAAVGLALSSTASASAADDEAVATAQHQLLDKYCIVCHNYTDNAGGIMPTRSFFSIFSVTAGLSCGAAGS